MSCEWVPAKEKPWAFTLKHNVIRDCDYVDAMQHMLRYGHLEHVVYEDGAHSHRHIHGIIILPKNMLRKRLMMPDYHLHLTEITDAGPWLKYLTKEQRPDNRQYMF